MDTAYDFGMILQKLRTERGITQKQLADMINKESSIISKYEKNLQSPTFDTVRSFAAIFNVSMDYLSGMEKSINISTVKLTEEQIQIMRELAEAFRDKQTAYPKKLSS
ncbi:MAG: helix-turn-helix transcriptional regulator, partial [Oscillospiraceae bacterium]|nr:helix-turn-helix transcriptional regulator [Oscillospiraceae bacterium]